MRVKLIFRFQDGAREEPVRKAGPARSWSTIGGETKSEWEEVFENTVNGIDLPVSPFAIKLDEEYTQIAGHFGTQNFQYPKEE